jgi:hypothetical protein
VPAEQRVAEAESKFTPGPWSVKQGSHPKDFIVAEATGNTVCEPSAACFDFSDLDPSVHRITLDEAKANACLIAAAPDMLQALHEVADDCYVLDGEPDSTAHCRFCDHSEGARHDIDCVMSFINSAIAKAEGGA